MNKQLRNLLLATTALGAIAIAPPASAQTVRAANFSGTTCIYHPSLPAPFPSSPSGEISAWLGFQTIGPGQVQTIFSSSTNGAGAANIIDFYIVNTVGQSGLANGNHLFLLTTDGTGGTSQQYSQWVSDEVLDPTGWHHAFAAWDTSQMFTNGQYTVVAFWDGIELTPNAANTHGQQLIMPTFFTTPYVKNSLNNAYTVGCFYDPVTGTYSATIDADLAELYMAPLGSATYPDLTPFGEFRVTQMNPNAWGPKDLGNFCLTVTESVIVPIVCLRGPGATQFKTNLLPSTSTVFSTAPGFSSPTTSVDDPFLTIQ